jgi:hypothetical protein
MNFDRNKNIVEGTPKKALEVDPLTKGLGEQLVDAFHEGFTKGSIDPVQRILDESALAPEQIRTPEIQYIIQEGLGYYLSIGLLGHAQKIIDFNILTPEQLQVAIQEGLLYHISGDGLLEQAQKIINLGILTPEQIRTPEIQVAIQSELVKSLETFFSAEHIQKIINLGILTPEQIRTPEIQAAAKKGLERYLSKGNTEYIQKIINLDILTPEEIQILEIQIGNKKDLKNYLSKGNTEDAQEIINLNILTPEQIQIAAKEGLGSVLSKGNPEHIQKIINLNILTPEQLQETVRKGLVNSLVWSGSTRPKRIINLNILTPEQLQETVREGLVVALQDGLINSAQEIIRLNILNPEEIVLPVQMLFESNDLSSLYCLLYVMSDDTIELIQDRIEATWRVELQDMKDAKDFFVHYQTGDWDQEREMLVFAKRRQFDSAWQDQEVQNIFVRGEAIFGKERMLRYVATERERPHDVLFAFEHIVELCKISGLAPEVFYNNILSQVARDNSVYQEGTSYQYLNALVQSVSLDIEVLFNQANSLTAIPQLQELCRSLGSKDQVFASWANLKKYAALEQILQRKDLLDQLVTLRGQGKKELAQYVETLAFGTTSQVDMGAVMEFWQSPESFLKRKATYGNVEWHERLKPSNYTEQQRLDLSAEDLRDALVEGKMDTLAAIRPFEIHYELPLYDVEPEPFVDQLKRALGSSTEGISPEAKNFKKLFNEVGKILATEKSTLKDFLGGRIKISAATQEALTTALYHKDYGIPKPKVPMGEFVARIGAKSDPSVVIAGNDTACCMPFGDGKNNAYMFNPNTAQFVIQQVRGDGKLRTIAQSILTKDKNIDRSVTEVLVALQNNEGGNLSEVLTETVLAQAPAFLACDSIEVAANYRTPRYDRAIRTLYQDFFYEYLQRYGEEDGLNQETLLGGVEASYGLRDTPKIPNTFLPQALLSYSDKVGKDVYAPRVQNQDSSIAKKTITAYEGHKKIESMVKIKGVSALTFEDVLAVGYIEGKEYDGLGMQEGLTEMQNALIAKDIINQAKDRPNMSLKYTDKDGLVQGYILAYEGSGGEEGNILYIRDLATRTDATQVAGGRLIQAFVEQYEQEYLAKDREPIAFAAEMRESTSYPLLEKMVATLNDRAEKYGVVFEVEGGGEYSGQENRLHSVFVRPVTRR